MERRLGLSILSFLAGAGAGVLATSLSQRGERQQLVSALEAQMRQLERLSVHFDEAPAAGVSASELRAELTRALTVERDRCAPASSSGPSPTEASAPIVKVTAQQTQSVREAHGLIDSALSRREWTEHDALELRQRLADLSESQRDEVTQRLITSLNSGELKALLHGPPF